MSDKSYFPTDLGEEIFERKYRCEMPDAQTFYQTMAKRVSLGSTALEKCFNDLFKNKRFSPGGRILAWAGRMNSKTSLINCTTHEVEGDSLDDIAETARVIMKASSRGQGIGINLSKLRPVDAPVDNAAVTSTGSTSFMEMLNQVGGTIGQNGRRAALLFALSDHHPDLWRDSVDIPCPNCHGKGCFKCRGKGGFPYDFMSIKKIPGRVENANISVLISDAFMEAVIHDQPWKLFFDGESGGKTFHVERTVSARELFRKMAESAWASAEPGVLFWDTAKRMSNSDLFGPYWGVTGVNACVSGDSVIRTENGLRAIKLLCGMDELPRVMAIDEKTKEVVYEKPLWVKKTRENAPVLRIVTTQTYLILTDDHKVLTADGWVEAGKLCLNDKVLTYNPFRKCFVEDGVVSITQYGTRDVYDIGMPEHHNFVANNIVVHNCSEQVLDQDGVCDLGSLNLASYVIDPFTKHARFNFPQLAWDTSHAVHFLDNVLEVELNENRSITERQRESIIALRRVGLGVMGLADALAMLGLRYEANEETLRMIAAIMRTIRDTAYLTSVDLSSKLGPCGVWYDTTEDERRELVEQGFYATLPRNIKDAIISFGLRNVALLSIAPTGSISNLYGVSSGVEPVFAREYQRVVRMGGQERTVTYVHPGVRMSREMGLPDSIWQTAYEVSPTDHVLIQAEVQKYVDAGCSKTTNLPNSASIEDVENIFMLAWENDLKGITVYRDGSREMQILTSLDDHEADGKCPACGGQLVKQEGCESCLSCGYGKCS